MKSKWLLIGGAGYVGSHIASTFKENNMDFAILDDFSTGIKSRVENQYEFEKGDATDSSTIISVCKRLDISNIINLAAFMQARESVRDPIKYWKNNLGVSLALAEALKSLTLDRLVLSSSCSVYGELANATESSDLNPMSPYAYTKVASEQILAQACRENKVEFVALRYFNVIGAGRFPNSEDTKLETLVPSVFRSVQRGESPTIYGGNLPTRDGTCERDFIDVRDLAKAHLKVCQSEEVFEESYLNVSTGKTITVFEVVKEIIRISNSMLEPVYEFPKLGDPISVSALPSARLIDLGWVPEFDLKQSIESHWEAATKSSQA